MSYKLSKTSLSRLDGVHPDLVKVVIRAIAISRIDFGVAQGLRTYEQQIQLVAEGKSTTLNSKHLPQADGYAHAVDLFAFVDGKADWTYQNLRLIIQAMMTAAIEEGVQIKAGGLWRDFLDSPHFELDQEYYA
ncbi:M15 family metallopeptidase [Thiomicrorhabdus sp.]|uniref:M15 family metallopeptidase n=1 Tax=Thiomicrorhabdus sp. TaxID=2039724 RepID=UPI0029C68647|nr:M15 family metallopeptidase [Thiomicrorhabdus sp.]